MPRTSAYDPMKHLPGSDPPLSERQEFEREHERDYTAEKEIQELHREVRRLHDEVRRLTAENERLRARMKR